MAKLRSLMTQLRGPGDNPWGPNARAAAVRYFSRNCQIPPAHVLADVAEEPKLSEEQVAALPKPAREAYQARRVSDAVGAS